MRRTRVISTKPYKGDNNSGLMPRIYCAADPLHGANSDEIFYYYSMLENTAHDEPIFCGSKGDIEFSGLSKYYNAPVFEESKTPLIIPDLFGNLIKRPINPEDDCC